MTLEALREERLLLVERLRGLPEADRDRPSLCRGWSIRHVLAHLVTPFTVAGPAMALAVTRPRSDRRRHGRDSQAHRSRTDPAQLLATLEANARSSSRPRGCRWPHR